MEEISFMMQTLSVLVLLIICSFTYILSKKINFPYTVLLVLAGLLLIPISYLEVFSFIDDFKLTPDVLFFVFLPVLLFEGGYNINYRQLLNSWKSIAFLAIFGLIISGGLIAGALYFILPYAGLNIPFLVCLLFGVIISSTDPVAVISIFKSLGAPRRLTMIFEGESIFNDGTAVALFLVILGLIYQGAGVGGNSIYIEGTLKFLSMLFGGILFGTFMGVLFSNMIGHINNNEEVEIVLTMTIAHITFISAELINRNFEFLPISGIIATVIASVIIGNYGRYKISPRAEKHMNKFWELFAFISNSIVFILMGLMLSTIDIGLTQFILPVIICILTIMFARLISVYIPVSIINLFKLEDKIPKSWILLLSWGSLRGALVLMMILMIPGVGDAGYEKLLAYQNLVGWSYGFSIKDFLLVLTIGSIMFTLFVEAPTTPIMMRQLRVDKLNRLEEFEYEEGKILTNLKIIEKINSSYKKAYLTKIEHDELLTIYSKKLKDAVDTMKTLLGDKVNESKNLIRKAISLHALGIEKQHLKKLFFYNEIDEHNFKYILRKIEKQIERIEHDNSQLSKIYDNVNDYDIFSKFMVFLYKKTSTDLDSYIRNRSRVIITRKVIKELRELAENDFGFDKEIFEEVIYLYSEFNKNADEKRIKIFSSHKATINAIESNLANKSLLKLEEKVVKELYEKEIITPKLHIRFMDNIKDEMYSDLKKLV